MNASNIYFFDKPQENLIKMYYIIYFLKHTPSLIIYAKLNAIDDPNFNLRLQIFANKIKYFNLHSILFDLKIQLTFLLRV